MTLLRKDIHNIKLEWFKEHHIERLIVDGQDLYSSAVSTYSTFLRKLYTSQKIPSTVSSDVLPQKLFPFKLARMSLQDSTYEEMQTMLVLRFTKKLQSVLKKLANGQKTLGKS